MDIKKTVLLGAMCLFLLNGAQLFSVDSDGNSNKFPWLFAGAGMQIGNGYPSIASENDDGIFSLKASTRFSAGFFIETVLASHFSTALIYYPINPVYSGDGTFGVSDYQYSVTIFTIGFQGKIFAHKDCIGPFAGVSFYGIGSSSSQSNLTGSNFDEVKDSLNYSGYSLEIGNRLYLGTPFIILDLFGSYLPEKELVSIGLSVGIGLSNKRPALFN